MRPAPPLHVVERDAAGTHIVSFEGELDIETVGVLCARVDAARDAGVRRLLIDLTRLRFCDSAGLRALTGAVDAALAPRGATMTA